MISWIPSLKEDRALRVLCLGAHCDDIEIGCGGSLLEWMRGDFELDVRWVVFSGNRTRADEALRSAEYWLAGASRRSITQHDFKDGFFPDEWAGIKQVFEQLKASFDPDLVLTHRGRDRHQDHRIISELTWNTFRNHTILEYEIPKYDGDLETPGFYVPVSSETARTKALALVKFFNSQGTKHWFSEELFLGLMRIRGIECCAPSGYAEAFHVRKLVMAL